MSTELQQLIEKYLEGTLDSDRQDELAAGLKADPRQMQAFVEANLREQVLRDSVRGDLLANRVQSRAEVRVEAPAPSTIRGRLYVAILATTLSISVSWWWGTRFFAPPAESFWSIAMVQDIDHDLFVGERGGVETIEIRTGLLQMVFDDGVEVALQGPARYEVVSLGGRDCTRDN